MAEKSPAELVKEIRDAMGLTQEQFAAQFGVTVATVNRWENGRAVPQPLAMKNLKELAERHGIQ
ncbi:helix-turn-helix domain-containing protein [Candidatus Sumerlaeota bacterium]